MTKVVNKNTDEFDVYCGRGSIFGSPYEIGRDGTRDECIDKFRKWFNFLLRDSVFKREVLKLKDKRIACFCVPKNRCHLQIIADYLDEGDNLF